MAAFSAANLETFISLLEKALGKKTPFEAINNQLSYWAQKFNLSEKQKAEIITAVFTRITDTYTVQAMESSRAMTRDDFLIDLEQQKMRAEIELLGAQKELVQAQTALAEVEAQKAQKQIELADAEINFNIARSLLVASQSKTEDYRTLAVMRDIMSQQDQLRIKEAQFLSDVNFGYAAGGVMVPAELQSKMLDNVAKITSGADADERKVFAWASSESIGKFKTFISSLLKVK